MTTETVTPAPSPGGVTHDNDPVCVIPSDVHSLSPMKTTMPSAELPKFFPTISISVPPALGPPIGVTDSIWIHAAGTTNVSTDAQPQSPAR
eukprot:31342-Pelagococcus_subviridis.AAC.16